ncbi:MAG: 4-hydroxy-tetrahydrodipicolinate synthase [Gammaproteobacteria bacterium]|nr:4-hydroxy-tetrahydrodipicolinate synthase [Gammaproteobacteria bacterium]MBP9728583.1 4-hydroxy-tetrahydrodipicolinate synthase [Gammaproteobacteria bacterium]
MVDGSIVALVTPMTPTGAVDYASLGSLVDCHLQAQTQALVINGSTAEAITLSDEERHRILATVITRVAKRIPVIAGTGAASTDETIERTQKALALGADAALIVTPYYNRPTQEGLYQHYKAVAEAVPTLPIILYTVPSRTGVDFSIDTLERLSLVPTIIGLKDATADLVKQREILARCGKSFTLYSGDDASALAFIMQGGRGVISITANVAPEAMQHMVKAALLGQVAEAGELNTRLMPLHKAMCFESNPIPVKWALHKQGLIQNRVRLPLTTLSTCYHQPMIEAMQFAGVLPCSVS